MAAIISSDASTTEDSEAANLSVVCAMHVIDTHTKVTPFGDNKFKKFQECAAKWINVKESSESRVAAKFLQQQQQVKEWDRSNAKVVVMILTLMVMIMSINKELAGKIQLFSRSVDL